MFVHALVLDASTPPIVYASTEAGVFRTTNGGAHWGAADPSLSTADALALDPAHPATLYAGNIAGLFKTTDGGASWASTGKGLPSAVVDSLAVAVSNTAVLYATPAYQGGVIRSSDGGATWTVINSGLYYALGGKAPLQVQSLLVDPQDRAIAYAITGSGAFKLAHESTWRAIDADLGGGRIESLVIDPLHPAMLYATLYVDSSTRIIRSSDQGATWKDISSALPSAARILAIDPVETSVLYAGTGAGVFKTADSGASWVPTGSFDAHVAQLLVDPSHPATLYAFASGRVDKTTDAGNTWAAMNLGLYLGNDPNSTVVVSGGYSKLTLDPSHPESLYLSYQFRFGRPPGFPYPPPLPSWGLVRSTDGAAHWVGGPYGASGPYFGAINALAVDPISGALYVGSTEGTFVQRSSSPCAVSATTLCLSSQPGDQRFEVKVNYETSQGGGLSGSGVAVPLEGVGVEHGGLFLFFDSANPEMLVKVIDGCAVNGKFWVFSSASTNVGLTTTVRDTVTGFSRTYSNSDLTAAAPIQDVEAFACNGPGVVDGEKRLLGEDVMGEGPRSRRHTAASDAATGEPRSGGAIGAMMATSVPASGALLAQVSLPSIFSDADTPPCSPDATTLCIAGRFQVEISYATTQGGGRTGAGNAMSLDSLGITRGGLFWFFDAGNPEMLIKVFDACSLDGKFWIFYSAGTNVGFTLTVTDMLTGHSKSYTNSDLTAALPIQDTSALECE